MTPKRRRGWNYHCALQEDLHYVNAPNLAEIDAVVRVVSTEPGGNSQ